MKNILRSLIDGDKRQLKRIDKLATKIESIEDQFAILTDQELKAKTLEFRNRYLQGESLDQLLPEAYAVVREAAKRVLGMKPFHVQIMGGIVIHEGNVAEMKTGEGKTLTATMPVYLNGLTGEGVHVITVNEYLSKRDAIEMGKLYKWLGLTVGLNVGDMSNDEKRFAYSQDITFTTESGIGFDYLRDNLAMNKEDQVQRGFNFALIDEVDAVLIDGANNSLIMSGAKVEVKVPPLYKEADQLVLTLTTDEDYEVDVQSHAVFLTEEGAHKAAKFFNVVDIYDEANSNIIHHVDLALKAHTLYHRDEDYIVREGQAYLVAANTGRALPGVRLGGGLHEAIEVKENRVEELAGREPVGRKSNGGVTGNISLQNLFRMYKKLSGMTGTGRTERDEFLETYNMDVVQIPTNHPIQRIDAPTILYPTVEAKYRSVVQRVKEIHQTGQPVLVGTITVRNSERLSELFHQAEIDHIRLNAKNDEEEAEIVKLAGKKGAVTIATNMAGRGTDIKISEEVKQLGGLAVIGTERHSARRVDDQLRGRAGRQGNPGYSQFYTSLEDDLIVQNGGEEIEEYLARLEFENKLDEVITDRYMRRMVDNVQLQIEGDNYQSRKRILAGDDTMVRQRNIIYGQRNEILNVTDSFDVILRPMVKNSIERNLVFSDEQLDDDSEFRQIASKLVNGQETNNDRLLAIVFDKYQAMKLKKGNEWTLIQTRHLILQVVNDAWTKQLADMEELQITVSRHTRSKIDYEEGGLQLFNKMIKTIEEMVTLKVMKLLLKIE